MKIKTLTKVQFIPIDAGDCWDFFSDPSNLAKITPPEMGFKITSALADMYPGQIITYRCARLQESRSPG